VTDPGGSASERASTRESPASGPARVRSTLSMLGRESAGYDRGHIVNRDPPRAPGPLARRGVGWGP
jgi:hypothetical protein